MPKHPVYGPPRRSGGQKGNLNALKFLKRLPHPYGDIPIVPHVGAGGGQGAPSRTGLKTVAAGRSGSGSGPAAQNNAGATGAREGPLSLLDRIIVIKTRQIGGRL